MKFDSSEKAFIRILIEEKIAGILDYLDELSHRVTRLEDQINDRDE